jgi:plastocyanin
MICNFRFFLLGLALACPTHVATRAATHTVEFNSNFFSPAAITVNVGDTVTFVNKGGFHTVTGSASDPFCGNDAVENSCSVTFKTAGTFPYSCLFHASQGMTGTVTVQGAGAKPNVIPFHLNGWTSPVVLSRAPGNNISDPDFADDQDIWLDWAIANVSLTAGITEKFFTEVLIDGVSKASWFHEGLAPDTFNKIEDYNLGKLPLGEHVLRLVTDHTSVVDESNESDNTYDANVRVVPSSANKYVVLLSDFRFNPASLTVGQGATVTFQILQGTHTATGAGADPFCGNNAIAQSCAVIFNQLGTFSYRCLFHAAQGMTGEIVVVPKIQAESAGKLEGPFGSAAGALVDYAARTVTFPVPFGPTYWRLNSSAALHIKSIQVNSGRVVIAYE